MLRLAHLSDLHFGAHDPHLVGAVAQDVRDQRPDLVVVSGDLTQRARREEFEAARAFLDALEAPWLAVPGNHDLAPDPVRRLLRPRARYERLVGGDQEWADARLAVLGIDSTWRAVWKGGRIGPAMQARAVAWAQRMRTERPGALLAMAAHHPFGALERGGHSPVRGARTALAAFAQAGVGLLLTGHDHAVATRPMAADGGVLVVQASTACSTRQRGEPNGYNVVEVDRATITVTPRAWDGARHRAGTPRAFPRSALGASLSSASP